MANNRRRHTRVRARGVAAHLRTEQGRTACQVENISMGGIFVRTDRLEEVGAEIFVDLVKPGWKRQLTLQARITSRVDALDGRLSKRMPGMGLQFVHVDDKQHDRLESILRELGAPEEDLQITLHADDVEAELRALELDTPAGQAPLDPQPQPVWQQVQMAAAEVATVQRSLVADIEGALRELAEDVPAPGPVEIQDLRPPRPAEPKLAERAREPAAMQPAAGKVPEADGRNLAAENARLMLQIRGLVMQLSDAQQQLAQRDLEIERLKEQLEDAQRG